MVALPGAIPVAIPLSLSITATLLLLLLQVPPGDTLLSAITEPLHMDIVPSALILDVAVTVTVIAADVAHPLLLVTV